MIRNDGLRFIDSNENEIYFAIATYVTLQRVKNFLVSKMNQIKSIGTFLQTGNGFRVTDPEGYVAVDRLNNAVKLVDRLEFSRLSLMLTFYYGLRRNEKIRNIVKLINMIVNNKSDIKRNSPPMKKLLFKT